MTSLQKSINKWKRIEAGTGVDKGWTNCALCADYIDNNCYGCPVCESGRGHYVCDGTPYDKWEEHHKLNHGWDGMSGDLKIVGSCRTCRDLAREEREFLESLKEGNK